MLFLGTQARPVQNIECYTLHTQTACTQAAWMLVYTDTLYTHHSNINLVVVGHDQYSPDVEHILHQLCMLRGAGGTTVDPIVEDVSWAEQ